MAPRTVKLLYTRLLPVVLLLGLLFASLYFLSGAAETAERFGRYHTWLLLLNGVALLVLGVVIVFNLSRLVLQYRAGIAGSRLTLRLVVLCIGLALVPVSVVYYFSLQFLQRGIDSWFDLRVKDALDDALELGRSALSLRLRGLLKEAQFIADELSTVPNPLAAVTLGTLHHDSGAIEMALFASDGYVIAASGDLLRVVPDLPPSAARLKLARGEPYVALVPAVDNHLQARVLVPVEPAGGSGGLRVLQAIYPVSERVNAQLDSVQQAYARYREMNYLRAPLKDFFVLTLSLVLLAGVLIAIGTAFYAARRLTAPIRVLEQGTRAVAAGDYGVHLPEGRNDELGFLVQSFNIMTRKLAEARDHARASRRALEAERAYLEAVLARLSSGVVTLGHDYTLDIANAAASQTLGIDLSEQRGVRLPDLMAAHAELRPLFNKVLTHLGQGRPEWREELTLFGASGRQVVVCRGAPLPGRGLRSGYLVVFEDVSTLVQAQRDAAWGEVARRLAHEIKNPLTPIQLSAERLRHRYLNKMDAKDAEVLDSSTHTIVQQVEAMKEMVNAFSEYARTPQLRLGPLQLNTLALEVINLYRSDDAALVIDLDLYPGIPRVLSDAGRLRQLLHNLVRNALDAMEGKGTLSVVTRYHAQAAPGHVDLVIGDTGPGLAAEVLGRLFEPYVTTKPRGTGLGLAIVRKIVEEHNGAISADNKPEGGARIVVQFPRLAPRDAAGYPAVREA